MFGDTGHSNAHFRSYRRAFEAEEKNAEGFAAKECRFVTHYRLKADPGAK